MDLSETKNLPKVDHTPAVLDETSRIMLKAADLIERKGLAKCDRQNSSGFCVHGALSYVETGSAHSCNAKHEDFAARRISNSLKPGHPYPGGVGGWNNLPETTKDEVVAKLRAVALGIA